MKTLLLKIALWLNSAPVLAANENDVVGAITSVIFDIIDKVKSVATPIAILAGVFCGIKLIMASDPQSVKSAKSWLITIVVAILVIYLAPALINTITGIMNSVA